MGLVAGQDRKLKAALEHRIWTRFPPDTQRPPVGGSQCHGIIERAVGLVACQARTLKAALGKTPLQRLHGRRDNTLILEFGEGPVHASQASKRRKV